MTEPLLQLIQHTDHRATGRMAFEYRHRKSARMSKVAKKMQITLWQLEELESGKAEWTERTLELYQWAVNSCAQRRK